MDEDWISYECSKHLQFERKSPPFWSSKPFEIPFFAFYGAQSFNISTNTNAVVWLINKYTAKHIFEDWLFRQWYSTLGWPTWGEMLFIK